MKMIKRLSSIPSSIRKRRCRALEPRLAVAVERLDLGALQLRQVALDLEPELGLQIAQGPVTLGDRAQQVRIELDPERRVDRVHAVLLVDRLAAHDRPAVFSFFEKIIKPAGADDVHQLALAAAALADGHLGLRHRAAASEVDARAAEEVQDAHALIESRLAHLDEFRRRALEPGGRHPAVVVPHRTEALPIAGVAPQRPVVDDFDDRVPVLAQSAFAPEIFTTLAHLTISSRRNLSNCSIDMPMVVVPCLPQLSFTSAELRSLFTSALSFSSTGRGVFAGAIRPSQMPDSYPGTPASESVGTSGVTGERLVPEVA